MTGNDTLLLVVARSVPGELENLSREVLKDSSEIDWQIALSLQVNSAQIFQTHLGHQHRHAERSYHA